VVGQPRLVIAGTRSGDGKTTVATGLMAALRGRGLRVSAHKVGPDYIDPGYHAAATGLPGRNLDPFLVGEDLIEPLFRHGAGPAEVSVVEGVMGLFDGAVGRNDLATPDFASTAHVARLLAAPIVLVVSAAGAGRSIAATVHGFASFDPRVQVAGVVLNRVSTPRHEDILRAALTDLGIPVLGALPAEAELHAPSRHLGLVPAAERAAQVRDWLPRLRELAGRHLDLDGLLAIARSAPALTAPAWSPADAAARPGARVRVAVAAGRAFTFGYAEHRELLEAAGAEVAEFDPLADEHLPAGCDALIAGGGFPEVYAAELAANAPLRAEVRQRAADGMPVVAECAGLLWLGAQLDGHQQCGVLPATARMTGKLTLGYREAVAVTSSPLVAAGTTIRAHEFHRTVSEPGAGPAPAWRAADSSASGWASDRLLASYLHVHWAGLPGAARRLLAAARAASSAVGAPSVTDGPLVTLEQHQRANHDAGDIAAMPTAASVRATPVTRTSSATQAAPGPPE
jgi:cobyrinic acid a,c-diamide synthase